MAEYKKAQEIVDESTDENVDKDVEDLREEKKMLRRPIDNIEIGENASDKKYIKQAARGRREDIGRTLEGYDRQKQIEENFKEEDKDDLEAENLKRMIGEMGRDRPVDSKEYSQKLRSTMNLDKQKKISKQKEEQRKMDELKTKEEKFKRSKKGPSTGGKLGAEVGAFFGYTRSGQVGGKILNKKIERKQNVVKDYNKIINEMESYKNSKLKEYEKDGLSTKEQQHLTSIMKKIDNMKADKQDQIKNLIDLQNQKSVDDKFQYMDSATAKKMGFQSKTNDFEKKEKRKKGYKIASNIESGSNKAIFGIINRKGVRPKFGKEFGRNLQGAEEAVAVPTQAYEDPFTRYIKASAVPMYPAQARQQPTRPESELNEDTGDPVEIDEQEQQPVRRKTNEFNVDDWILKM